MAQPAWRIPIEVGEMILVAEVFEITLRDPQYHEKIMVQERQTGGSAQGPIWKCRTIMINFRMVAKEGSI